MMIAETPTLRRAAPASTFVRHVYRGDGTYFETEAVGVEWTGFPGRVWMPSYRRSLGVMFGAILGGGFELTGLVEPRPDERFRRADPENHGLGAGRDRGRSPQSGRGR